MQKSITARHFDLTPEMKESCLAEVDGLRKFFDNIISAELVLDKERHMKKAELKIKVYNATITSAATSEDIYKAVSEATDKARVQLIKYKGKLKEKNSERITKTIDSLTKPSTDVDEIDV